LELSIVIVSYNAVDFLRLCLRSVEVACKHIEAEIFVVDNNSTDCSTEMVEQDFSFCKVISNKNNPGFAVANNQAIEQSSGRFVLLLNPDTIVAEDTLVKVISFMRKTTNAGGMGIRMLDGSGCYLPESKRGIPSPWTSFSKMTGLSSLFPQSKIFNEYHKGYLNSNRNNAVEILAGAFMCLRKTVLDELGLLDEDFFMYGEDIDLSYRILKGKYKNYYLADSSIIHFKGESTIKDQKYVNRFYNAMIKFAKKHFGQTYSVFLGVLIYIGVFVARFISYLKYFNFNCQDTYVVGEDVFILVRRYLPTNHMLQVLSQQFTIKIVDEIDEEFQGVVLFVQDKIPYKEMINCMDRYGDKFKYRFLDERSRVIVGSDNKFVKGVAIQV